MKKNTHDQLLIAFFKELLLCVKPKTIGTTAVSKYLNHHFITIPSLQPARLNTVNSLCRFGQVMKYSINLSHEAQ